MPFQVTNTFLLRIEADRVEALLSKRDISTLSNGDRRSWEDPDFKAHLESIGLDYTIAQLLAIRNELVVRNVIEI